MLRPVRNLGRALAVGLLGAVLFDLVQGFVNDTSGPLEKVVLVVVGVGLVLLAWPLFRQER